MEECGIRGPLNNWLKSYLSNRSMQTVISGTRGSEANIRYGVPTGSVYGPVGYIMHVNSLSNVIENCKMFMYADDTCLLYAHKDLQIIQKCIQKDLENIIKWSHDNGIIINMTKTKCMHICSPYNKPKLNSLRVVGHSYDCLHSKCSDSIHMDTSITACNCADIEFVEKFKYLGLTIDQNMSWKTHINNVCAKLRSALGKMYHLRGVVNRATLYSVYYALADSILSYGLSSYGCTFQTYLDQINSLQIRCMKLLVDKKTKKACHGEYNKLYSLCKMLPVQDKVKALIVLEEFSSEEFKNPLTHVIETRNVRNKKLIVPKVCNYYGSRTRKYLVPKILNNLPNEIRNGSFSKNVFKLKINNYLLANQNNVL
ncbi:hypothetical protein JYU34_014950 [Plutella xylostella]|uniref:Reverse transcriptase domain-containing protein n=1 Tax=Plutella xylostella TaxID=51655 RepID=A0ABQ7Q5X4_PLUXY|nr:hypothetical protein JYU34_014950 [Plutella xylostella]